mmetsp:Transcript_4310/g.9670  ORF Transcript_4310/g.9670 Transcript_4310/m.9670 type:complete len:238 (-) Transcript_4310:67-780(-)
MFPVNATGAALGLAPALLLLLVLLASPSSLALVCWWAALIEGFAPLFAIDLGVVPTVCIAGVVGASVDTTVTGAGAAVGAADVTRFFSVLPKKPFFQPLLCLATAFSVLVLAAPVFSLPADLLVPVVGFLLLLLMMILPPSLLLETLALPLASLSSNASRSAAPKDAFASEQPASSRTNLASSSISPSGSTPRPPHIFAIISISFDMSTTSRPATFPLESKNSRISKTPGSSADAMS